MLKRFFSLFINKTHHLEVRPCLIFGDFILIDNNKVIKRSKVYSELAKEVQFVNSP